MGIIKEKIEKDITEEFEVKIRRNAFANVLCKDLKISK